MNSHLSNALYSAMVKSTMLFEPRKCALNGDAHVVVQFPFRSFVLKRQGVDIATE